MRCATAEGTTCSLIVITADKKQVDTQWYVITIIGIPSLTTSKVIFFYAGISALEKECPVYIWIDHVRLSIPWRSVLLGKLVKKFPAFYWTRRFVMLFITVHHWSLSWATCIQSTSSHLQSLNSILILSSHLRLYISRGVFPPTKTLYEFIMSHACYISCLSNSLNVITLIICMKLLIYL